MKKKFTTNLENMTIYQLRMLAAQAGCDCNQIIEDALGCLFWACERAKSRSHEFPTVAAGLAEIRFKLGIYDEADREGFLRLESKNYDAQAGRQGEFLVAATYF